MERAGPTPGVRLANAERDRDEAGGRMLALARNLAAYVGDTLVSTHELRANNWGTAPPWALCANVRFASHTMLRPIGLWDIIGPAYCRFVRA